jgi:hypothetical protein
MTKTNIVDTNVILVANGQHDNVGSECVAECAVRLEGIMLRGRIALDSKFEVLSEYQNKTQPVRAKRPGDVFVKWALQNRSNSDRCDSVSLEENPQRKYEAFPDDHRLATFDESDRKFVAIASAHPQKPAILQATDSKWLAWNDALKDHGLTVEFLCGVDVERFRRRRNP